MRCVAVTDISRHFHGAVTLKVSASFFLHFVSFLCLCVVFSGQSVQHRQGAGIAQWLKRRTRD